MSVLTIAFPAEAAGPVSQMLLNAARPLIGLGLLATLLVVFKPLLTGLLRAALLLLAPRQTREERSYSERIQGVLTLHRMAREFDDLQPSQAAELRLLASRG